MNCVLFGISMVKFIKMGESEEPGIPVDPMAQWGFFADEHLEGLGPPGSPEALIQDQNRRASLPGQVAS